MEDAIKEELLKQVDNAIYAVPDNSIQCFTPLSRPGWTFALPSSQVAGALLHPPLPTRRERAQLLIQLRLQPTFKG